MDEGPFARTFDSPLHAVPPVISPRSNLYDCLCVSCAKAEDNRDLRSWRQASGPQAGGAVYTCKVFGCKTIAGAKSLCLYCCRRFQRCLSCNSYLAVVFNTAAKFQSFRRFPLVFRDEARQLLLICRRLSMSRDIRVLLVKALASQYEHHATLGPELLEMQTNDLRIRVHRVVGFQSRVFVHIYHIGSMSNPEQALNVFHLPPEIARSHAWTLVGRTEKKNSNSNLTIGGNREIPRLAASAFPLNFAKSWTIVDPVTCSFTIERFQVGVAPQEQIVIEFKLPMDESTT